MSDVTPGNARAELSLLFASVVRDRETVNDLMRLMGNDIRDEWDQIDISTMVDGPRTHFIDQRYIVVRIPREGRRRAPDRSQGLGT